MTDVPLRLAGEPMLLLRGVEADTYGRAWERFRESGYDQRLAPSAAPGPDMQALYDTFDRGDWPPA